MKEIHIRRHAPRHPTGDLSDEGKDFALRLKKSLPPFDLVISSHRPRAIETATLLTDTKPTLDERVTAIPLSPTEEKDLHERGQNHPFGIAGVILEDPKYNPLIQQKAVGFSDLINEILKKLPAKGKALIISHDGIMVLLHLKLRGKPLNTADITFGPLQGFIVYEDLSIRSLGGV